jgi:hypothetical protein
MRGAIDVSRETCSFSPLKDCTLDWPTMPQFVRKNPDILGEAMVGCRNALIGRRFRASPVAGKWIYLEFSV